MNSATSKSPKRNQRTGTFGESIVSKYLEVRGDEILDRNWRIREGEIDIVSLDTEGTFHFIEVKTRSSLAFGHPLEAIDRVNVHRMQRLALAWLATHSCFGCDYTIDAAAVLLAADGTHTLDYRSSIL